MFQALFSRKKKMSAANAKSSVKRRVRRQEAMLPDEGRPFSGADPSVLKIFVRNGSHSRVGGQAELTGLAKAIQAEYGSDKTTLTSEILHREIHATTLTHPNFHLVAMPPRMAFSRLRNFEADAWEELSHERADAFVYHLRVGQTEEYLSAKKHYMYDSDDKTNWERDRFEISRFLQRPSLMENPGKPLLLLVNSEEDPDLDLERLANLFGLNILSPHFSRPFRAVVYSTSKDDPNGTEGVLKEAFQWLAKSAHSSQDDEGTALTGGSETEEESSVVTMSTAGTTFMDSSPNHGGGHFIMDYEPTLLGGNPTLQRFDPIKTGTHCPFARGARLWGGKVADDEHEPRMYGRVDSIKDPIKEAASLNAGPLAEFVARSSNGENIDGFCVEIPCASWGDVKDLGEKVRLFLMHLADSDPAGENAMKMMGPVDSPHWRFRFASEDFFLTTFSPAYPEGSSRYAFGVRRAFILFQPLTSFGRHGLSEDTPASATNWENPTSMRDKARVAFKKNGCPYHIPEDLPYPVAEHVVKPEKDDGTTCVRWWEKNN